MKTIASHVLENWRSRNVSLVEPSNEAAIHERLSSAGLAVGRDFIEFLSVVGGMEDGESGLDLWVVWNLDHIVAENKNIQKEGVYFADWCINSHLHLIRRESPDVSSVWVDHFDDTIGVTKIANSVEEFFRRYLARDESIGIHFENE